MNKYWILLVSALLVVSSAAEEQPEMEEEGPGDVCPQCFYNMITFNWPEAVCKLEENNPSPKPCRDNLPQQFTIHG